MLTGADVRRYRQAISQTQTEFAQALGLSQAALSLIEKGRTALSDEHIAKLTDIFGAPRFSPSFREFLKQLDAGRAESQAAIESPRSRYSTLTVWRWEEGLDLSRELPPAQIVDMLTIRTTDRPAIAFSMPKKSSLWAEGEIFVFEQRAIDEVRDADICLVQVRASRGRTTRTLIAAAHLAPAKRGRSLQLEPISPAGPIFPARDESLVAVFPAIYRGRYLTGQSHLKSFPHFQPC